MEIAIDIVSVFHSELNRRQAGELHDAILEYEPGGWRFITVDNREDNRGFAKGCNWGAFHPRAKAPVIGFLNPDTLVDGPFIDQVLEALDEPATVITGCRFDKPAEELKIWGCHEWVCGATFFVRRDFFTGCGGFDEGYVWAFEETDLIRQAQVAGKRVKAIDLPLRHESPSEQSEADAEYKRYYFTMSQRRFAQKWKAKPPTARRRSGGYVAPKETHA